MCPNNGAYLEDIKDEGLKLDAGDFAFNARNVLLGDVVREGVQVILHQLLKVQNLHECV